ncbi:hypothetical protein GGF32_005159 [Allomyces javanicus]|nr:hypothetical protein GGF32_005159 [Allomyces javanicus]
MAAPSSPPRRRVHLFPYHLTAPLALAVLIASRTTTATALTTTSADDADAEAANNRTVTIALGVGFGAFFLAVVAFYAWRRRVDQQHGLKRAATLASQALPRTAPMQAAMPPSPGVMKPPAPVYQQEKQGYYGAPPYSPTSAVSKTSATAVNDGAGYGAQQPMMGGRMGPPPGQQAPASLGGYGQRPQLQQEIQQQPPMHQQQPMRSMYAGSNVGGGPASSLVGSTVVGSAANAPNKRMSSLIADKNVSLKDLLRASQALDASEVAAITNNIPSPAPSSTVVPGAQLTESPAASLQRNDGMRYRATRNYNAAMADELPLRIGEVVEVVQVYDDGWAFAFLVDSGRPGVVPMSFLEKLPPPSSAQQQGFPPARRQPMNKRPSAPSASAPMAMSSVPAQPTASAVSVQQQPAPRAAQARDTVMIYEDDDDDDDDDETETGSPATPPVIDRGLPSPTTARPPTTPTTPTTPMNVYHSPSQSRPAARQPPSPTTPTAKTTDIDTLMSVLSQIAKTDRASRLLTDLRLDFSNPAAARASVMHAIDEETRAGGGATPESKKKNRVSLSALLHALPPHAADDPTAVANAWIKGAPPVPNAGAAGARPPARNAGGGAPPRAAAAAATRAPAAPGRSGAPPRSAMRSASSGQGHPRQQRPSVGFAAAPPAQIPPASPLSDLDELQDMLSREEAMLRGLQK